MHQLYRTKSIQSTKLNQSNQICRKSKQSPIPAWPELGPAQPQLFVLSYVFNHLGNSKEIKKYLITVSALVSVPDPIPLPNFDQNPEFTFFLKASFQLWIQNFFGSKYQPSSFRGIHFNIYSPSKITNVVWKGVHPWVFRPSNQLLYNFCPALTY